MSIFVIYLVELSVLPSLNLLVTAAVERHGKTTDHVVCRHRKPFCVYGLLHSSCKYSVVPRAAYLTLPTVSLLLDRDHLRTSLDSTSAACGDVRLIFFPGLISSFVILQAIQKLANMDIS